MVAAALAVGASLMGASSAAAATPYLEEVYPDVSIRQDQVYGSAPDAEGNAVQLELDLYEPVGDVSERRPAIVWVHGGGFGIGSRDNPKIVDLATTFARRGYVTASITYRLLADQPCSQQEEGSPECVVSALAAKDDAQAAVRWLRASRADLRIDPSRIAIGGFSAGAVTSLLVGTWPENPGTSGNPGERSDVQAVVSNCGYLPRADLITQGDAPAAFFHGTNDAIIPIAAAQATHAAFLAAGLPTEFTAFQGAGHCPNWDVYREPTLAGTAPFLYAHLRLPMKRRCDVVLEGGEYDDELSGTEFGDVIRALAGDDRLRGYGAGDCLRAGPGDDKVFAGGGEDEVRCGPGDDVVHADRRDSLRGCERIK